jgi:hypothetical protein
MRKGFRVITLFLVCSLMLCGCGTSLYELTEEEETVIVHYAAYVLAKHNVYQKDGMVAISEDLLEEDSEEAGTEEALPDETEQETEASEQQSGSGDTAESTAAEPANSISIAEAVGYDGQLDIAYTGFTVVNNFQEGRAYSLDAHAGYDFVVAQFTMKNISGEAIDVDVMSRGLTFRMSYEENRWIKEDVTLLLTDLSTYTDSLASDESVDLVLLFEVPEDDVASIGELSFSVDKDGENYSIAQ